MVAIVILHGWGSEIEKWNPFKKELEKAGFEVFLPHLPGFGQADPSQQAWSVSDYAQWVKNKTLPENYFLIGHSFGGRIAIKLASENPKNLKGLILINSAGIKPKNSLKRVFFLVLAKMGKLFFDLPPFLFFKDFSRKILYKLAREKDYYQAKGVMRKTMKKVIGEDLKKDLKRIKIPTLILWGERDSLTPLADGELMNRLISGSSLLIFSKANHSLPLKMPEEVAQEIVKFIREVK
ncbi:alpha/beta hydrolase [Candidatus Microgenomates bacterium]|nr:alpha/beta hydrolase [Candidatus Microgenomates bacterium]